MVASSWPCSSSSSSNGRPIIISPVNQPNHVSRVMEPPQQVHQLPSSRFLSSDQQLQSASTNVPPICNVPLGDELERIQKKKLVLKDDNQNEWKELGTQETMVRANKIVADSLNVSLTLSCQCCNKVIFKLVGSYVPLPRITSPIIDLEVSPNCYRSLQDNKMLPGLLWFLFHLPVDLL